MPINNRIAALQAEVTAWRRDFHENPELHFEVHRTAGIVAEKLRDFGFDEVITGLGKTGVVGVLRGQKNSSGKVIGLRADMDALPIAEESGVPHASKIPGKMHACGHDGHTAMLLGAAKYLAETRNFDGIAIFIFQPAEEVGGGAKAMIEDGLLERFGVQEVYGLHNTPNRKLGQFATKPGAMLASADFFSIEVTGKGGHAAAPHACVDPVLVGAQIVMAVQSLVARNVDPIESAVVSICQFRAGNADNVIPETVTLGGTVRNHSPTVQDMIERRLGEVVERTASLYGAKAVLHYQRSCPVTANDPDKADFAAQVARLVIQEAGQDETGYDPAMKPSMGAEDFSFMLQARPGAFINLGTGEGPGLHHPAYDFNDEVIPLGMSYWAKLVETSMPA